MSHCAKVGCYCPNCDRGFDRAGIEAELAELRTKNAQLTHDLDHERREKYTAQGIAAQARTELAALQTKVSTFNMKNKINIKRIAGDGARCTVNIQFEFDHTDQQALERYGRIMRELIPEEERAQFVADFHAAATDAGFRVAP